MVSCRCRFHRNRAALHARRTPTAAMNDQKSRGFFCTAGVNATAARASVKARGKPSARAGDSARRRAAGSGGMEPARDRRRSATDRVSFYVLRGSLVVGPNAEHQLTRNGPRALFAEIRTREDRRDQTADARLLQRVAKLRAQLEAMDSLAQDLVDAQMHPVLVLAPELARREEVDVL